jgi:hypothetical protein
MSESCNFKYPGFRASLKRLPCSLALATSLFIVGACPIFAVEMQALTDTEATNLGKIETKLFAHPYKQEQTEDRLARIEKAVFGETKTGSAGTRITALLQAVPNLEQPAAPAKTASSPASTDTSQNTAPTTSKRNKHKFEDDTKTTFKDNGDTTDGDIGSYPAVSAMEKRLLGKEYASDPIGQRLDRLEMKVDGHVSTLTDLSDRTDHLKSKTHIDVAHRPPVNADWNDDDDDTVGMGMPTGRGRPRDDYSLGPRDLNLPGAPPTVGIGSGLGSGGSGRYGFGGGSSPSGYPRQAGAGSAATSTLGIGQQVTALEMEIFGKIYAKDSLNVRLTRLEKDIFPGQKTYEDQDVPKRVQRLVAAYPLNGGQNQQVARRNSDDDLMDDLNGVSQGKGGSGLGKIISSISNYLSGGGSAGGYASSGTYITDPQTGMMIDQVSGNIIDPSTGTVIGNRGSNLGGLGTYGTTNSFNNGFSPFGSPMGGMGGYGYSPYGSGYGSGVHFGFGGGGRMGGMWP